MAGKKQLGQPGQRFTPERTTTLSDYEIVAQIHQNAAVETADLDVLAEEIKDDLKMDNASNRPTSVWMVCESTSITLAACGGPTRFQRGERIDDPSIAKELEHAGVRIKAVV